MQQTSASLIKREMRTFKADKLLEQSADENLKKALIENKFACICLQANKLDKALKHFLSSQQQIQSLLPDIPFTNAWMNLGNTYSQLKQYEKALECYQQVIQNSPYTKTEYDNKSIVWSGKLNSYAAFVDAHTNLACLLANMDRLEQSYEFCLKAIEMNPQNFEAQINFGDLLRQLGRKEEALDHTWTQIVKYTQESNQDYQRPKPINCQQLDQVELSEPLNIFCVKWGKKYGPDYVNKLYQGVRKNTTLDFNFYCLTDDNTDLLPEIKSLDLEGGWTGWWGKATLFQLQIPGRYFYIDLDMIITGNIDEILKYSGNFAIMRTDEIACEKANKNGYNSSLMAWRSNDIFKQVYDELHKNSICIQKFIVRFDFWLEMMIEKADFLQELFPTQISDYVQECTENLPSNTRIVSFPRTPKPHDATAKWISEFW